MSATLNLSSDALREVAQSNGVCVRPIVHEVHDSETGKDHLIPTPCGSTWARKCAPCAEKARRLRMQQCREGWHLETEPERPDRSTAASDEAANGDDTPADPMGPGTDHVRLRIDDRCR